MGFATSLVSFINLGHNYPENPLLAKEVSYLLRKQISSEHISLKATLEKDLQPHKSC